MMCGVTFHDFVTASAGPDGGLFMFTEAMFAGTAMHAMRRGFNEAAHCNEDRRPNRCFDPSKNDAVFKPLEKGGFAFFIAGLCAHEKANACSVPEFFKMYIKLPLPARGMLWYSQGALFSATREQIRRRPIEDYNLLLFESSKSSDPSVGYFMEW